MTRRILLLAFATVVAGAPGCSRDATAKGDKPASDTPWAPAQLTSVKGVPAAEIEAELRKALAGSPLEKIDDEQWGHTNALYKAYGNQPLWLSPDGLHEDRAYALANAILQAEQDGMRMDAYPVGALARAMSAVTSTAKPTAQQ